VMSGVQSESQYSVRDSVATVRHGVLLHSGNVQLVVRKLPLASDSFKYLLLFMIR